MQPTMKLFLSRPPSGQRQVLGLNTCTGQTNAPWSSPSSSICMSMQAVPLIPSKALQSNQSLSQPGCSCFTDCALPTRFDLTKSKSTLLDVISSHLAHSSGTFLVDFRRLFAPLSSLLGLGGNPSETCQERPSQSG